MYCSESLDTGTPEFKRWFGASRVSANGVPKVVYHGTPHNFNAFDIRKLGQGNDQYGVGFYFTDSPDWAAGYGNIIMPCYIRIVKPIVWSRQPNITLRQARAIACGLDRAETIDALEAGYDVKRMGFARALEEYCAPLDGFPMVEALNSLYNDFYRGRALNYMFSTVVKRCTGYDGVINDTGEHTIYVVFTPQQIKSAIGNSGRFRRVPNILD